MMSLKRDVPAITSVIVQSDNASCYQNACVALLLPIIGAASGIQVLRFEHTETQDQKSSLDAHFAQAHGKVKRFAIQGNNCVTPRQYVCALSADAGMSNCIPALVYDREKLAEMLAWMMPMETALNKNHGRTNNIECREVVLGPSPSVSTCTFPDYRMVKFTYSGVDAGVEVIVSPTRRTCHRASVILGQSSATSQ